MGTGLILAGGGGGAGHPAQGDEIHHIYVQALAPVAADPLQVGDLWSDTTANLLKRCSNLSPITFVSTEGGSTAHDLFSATHTGDVNDSDTPGDNEVLTFDSGTSKWNSEAASGHGVHGGDVTGPGSSVDNSIVRFDGTTGKIIQGYTSGGPIISDTGTITATQPLILDDTSLQIQEGVDTLTITVPTLTAARAVTLGDLAGRIVLDADNLSVFAATTSAQLAGVISDETGSGLLVFGTSPTIVTPTIAATDWTDANHAHAAANSGGTLNASAIAAGTLGVDRGGTGATSLTDGGVLLGSGTGAITAMAVLGDGAIVVGDGTTDPVALTAFTSSTGQLTHERGGIEADISAITTGGMLRGTGSGVMAVSTVGTDGQVLTAQADSTIAWEDAASGGGDLNDDALRSWGTDGDFVGVLNSAGLAADTELTDVIVGTSVYELAIPANSMIFSNITADGDIVFFTQTGGNSIEAMRIDASTRSLVLPSFSDAATPTLAFGDGDTGFYESSDDSLIFVIGGTAQIVFNSNDFQGGVNDNFAIRHSITTSISTPNYTFRNDLNTGMGHFGTDALNFIVGGVEMIRLTESITLANYVGVTIDASDQVSEASLSGSTWRLIQTQAINVDWDGGTLITVTDGLGLFLGAITQTADQATTITTASTLFVSNPVAGSNITITNNYAINTESGAFLTAAGAWTDDPSTRLKKHDIMDVSHEDMHLAIGQIRGRSWVYNDEFGDEGRIRYGVVAEEQPDFLYGLGTTQRNVTTPSIMAGFALAAVAYHEDEIGELKARIAFLEGK